MDLVISLLALGLPRTKSHEKRRFTVIFSTADFCLWKAHLSHSFDKLNTYWNSKAISAMYLSMLRKRIMADRTLSLSKIYKDNANNPMVFEEVWDENPREIRVLKGPKCIQAVAGEVISLRLHDLSVLMDDSEAEVLIDSDLDSEPD
jgi:hypothetical protein